MFVSASLSIFLDQAFITPPLTPPPLCKLSSLFFILVCLACFDVRLSLLSHTACDCNPISSVSAVCDKQTGVCQCHEGVTGEKCDQCLPSTTGLLPFCELCDECSSSWEERVKTLEASAAKYIMIAGSINVTNMTSAARLQPLFALLEEIEMYLNSSEIDSLLNSTLDLFHDLCMKISLLESLLSRAMLVKVELNDTFTNATILNSELTQIISQLQYLVSLSANISAEAAQLKTVVFASFVDTIREAEERSNASLKLVMTEFASNITEANQILQEFLSKESEFLLIVDEVVLLLSELEKAIERYGMLVDSASRTLCGNPQGQKCDGDGMCGGVGCEFCGGGECGGSVDQVRNARSISDQALQKVKKLLESLTNTTFELGRARNESKLALNNSFEAKDKAGVAQLMASGLSSDTEQLLVVVVDALSNNLSLFSLEMLGMIENETLLLRISKTPEEVRLNSERMQ